MGLIWGGADPHRFLPFYGIGQIFHNRYIFYKEKASSEESWNKPKPRKGDFRELKSKTFPMGACPGAPLEACSLGYRQIGQYLYPRSAPAG